MRERAVGVLNIPLSYSHIFSNAVLVLNAVNGKEPVSLFLAKDSIAREGKIPKLLGGMEP